MNYYKYKPSKVIARLAHMSEKSKVAISKEIGRNKYFLGTYTSSGRIPNIVLLTEIARACGYKVHIIGHDEDITLDLE